MIFSPFFIGKVAGEQTGDQKAYLEEHDQCAYLTHVEIDIVLDLLKYQTFGVLYAAKKEHGDEQQEKYFPFLLVSHCEFPLY